MSDQIKKIINQSQSVTVFSEITLTDFFVDVETYSLHSKISASSSNNAINHRTNEIVTFLDNDKAIAVKEIILTVTSLA